MYYNHNRPERLVADVVFAHETLYGFSVKTVRRLGISETDNSDADRSWASRCYACREGLFQQISCQGPITVVLIVECYSRGEESEVA